MKSSYDHKPEALMKYSAGTTLVNYNVEEVQRQITEGDTINEWQADTVEVHNPVTYSSLVSALIRTRYTADQVEAIMLNGGDTPEHKAELEALQQWRTEAKKIAKQVLANK